MANKKISALPGATTVAGDELIPIVQGGATKQVAVSLLTPASSATVVGMVELATTAEATAGTDTVRAVTPAGLKASQNLVASVKTANYTLVAADAGTVIEVNSATAVTVTVPNNILPTGSRVQVVQVGAGQVTLAQSGTMVLRTSTALTTRAQYAVLEIRARSATEAVVDAPASLADLKGAPLRPTVGFFVASTMLFAWMEGYHYQAENDAPIVVTVPLNASQALPIGYQIDIGQGNVGEVSFAPETAGVSLQSRGGARKLNGRYAIATLRKIGTDVWWLFGDITA